MTATSIAETEWLAALPALSNFAEIFEFVPDTYFYVKDSDCRWRSCNEAALALFNARSREEILGRTEHDFFPRQIADPINRDDRSIIETGRQIINKTEVIVDETGRLIWVSTTKLPLRDAKGVICGLMGVTRILHRTETLPDGYRQFSKVIHYIQEHYHDNIEVSALARIACLSESQFRKRFRKLFKFPPQQFILKVRMQAAARLLATTDARIVDIAFRSGFSDQSYFTRQFSGFFGLSPKKYRDRWNGRL